MINIKNISWKKRFLAPVMAFVASAVIFVSAFSADASSQGKITASGAVNVRAEASTSSEAISSITSGSTITILGQVTGADGYVWYQIYVNASTNGYVRSDLATITDGTTPGEVGEGGSSDTSIVMVNPITGSVAGSTAVRVRADASTSSSIVATAGSGISVTVNGYKEGTDSRTWYYVSFTDEGNAVSGFIRSDFITLSGDLVPVESGETPAETPTETTETPDGGEVAPATVETSVDKAYDTVLDGETWYLLDYANDSQYKIADILSINADLKKANSAKTALRVWMIIFIIIAIAGVGAAAYLFMKLRDVNDQAAFADAEKERRARLANGVRKPATQGSTGARPAQNGARPAGERPAQNGARPAGERANQNGARPAGERPAQNGARPAEGVRPAQGATRPEGVRPAQNGARPAEGVRPAQGATRPADGVRPAQGATRPAQNGVRPAQGSNGTRPVQSAGATRPVQTATRPQNNPKVSDDDDEFEFGFLNWDNKDSE